MRISNLSLRDSRARVDSGARAEKLGVSGDGVGVSMLGEVESSIQHVEAELESSRSIAWN